MGQKRGLHNLAIPSTSTATRFLETNSKPEHASLSLLLASSRCKVSLSLFHSSIPSGGTSMAQSVRRWSCQILCIMYEVGADSLAGNSFSPRRLSADVAQAKSQIPILHLRRKKIPESPLQATDSGPLRVISDVQSLVSCPPPPACLTSS